MRGMQDEEWRTTKVPVKSGIFWDTGRFMELYLHFIFISRGGSHLMQLFKVEKTP